MNLLNTFGTSPICLYLVTMWILAEKIIWKKEGKNDRDLMAERPLQQPQYRTIIPPIKKEEDEKGPIPATEIVCDHRDRFWHFSHLSVLL